MIERFIIWRGVTPDRLLGDVAAAHIRNVFTVPDLLDARPPHAIEITNHTDGSVTVSMLRKVSDPGEPR